MTALKLTRVIGGATTVVALVLLTLGMLTTSFKAGMADPVWPTEPWYLVVNGHVWQESRAGFLLEHTHRFAGWAVGGLTTLLALAAWFTDRRTDSRWFGLIQVVLLVTVYGQFHREMGVAWEARKAGTGGSVWPAGTGAFTLVIALLLGVAAAVTSGPHRWLRRLASLSLVAVMVQGLLGGYRVYLDQLAGVELAIVHGTLGQVVFCLLLATLTLARPPRPVPDAERDRVGTLALALPAVVFVQLVWGVLVRHAGSPFMQRLHILTAFVVAGLCVWLAVRVLATPDGRWHLGGSARHLLGIVGVQVLLGVEAWMGKFAAAGPQAAVPPLLREVTVGSGVTRTLHALVGACLLASAVVLALRVWRRADEPAAVEEHESSAAETVAA
jgi:heme A synthase